MLNSRQRGFTLVEVMVTLVILIFLIALAAPMAIDWLQNVKLRTAGESLRSGIERARIEALKRNTTVSFWMVADPNSRVPGNSCNLSSTSAAWVVSVQDPSGACGATPSLVDAPQLAQRSVALENLEGVTVSAVDATGAGATRVTFTGFGQVDPNASRIQMIDLAQVNGNGQVLRVGIDAGGSVRMCDPNAVSNDPRRCPVFN